MQNKLRIILFGVSFLSAIVFSSGMALPASAATSSSATPAQVSNVAKSLGAHAVALPLSRNDYFRGFRNGERDSDRYCRGEGGYHRHHHHPYRRHRRREDDYTRGYIDGWDYGQYHDRDCR